VFDAAQEATEAEKRKKKEERRKAEYETNNEY
jgi:hypothetical protein